VIAGNNAPRQGRDRSAMNKDINGESDCGAFRDRL